LVRIQGKKASKKDEHQYRSGVNQRLAPSRLLEPLASVLRESPWWLSIRSAC
jgi:hypothetical protein